MIPAVAPERALEPIADSSSGPARWRTPKRLLVAAAALWIASGVYIVPADQQAVVTQFGRVVQPRVMPGLHVGLPWPLHRVARLKVQQMQRAVIGGDATDQVLGRSEPLRSQFLTGDQNLIHLRTVAQYSVGVPVNYLYQTADPAEVVRSVVEAELARAIGRSGVDDVLTTGKAEIQERVRSAAQKRLDDYDAGIRLATVNIEIASPPAEAAEAFRDVASARADSSRIVSEAQGYANDLIPRARGEARQMLESAEGHKSSVVNQAQGDAQRFVQVAAEYERASEVNGRRLYMETLEQVLPRIRKVFVDKNGNLDLTVIRNGGTQK